MGYIISRDRYLKRDELGVIYQLCVAPGEQRKLVGAALVRAVFQRSAYGCKLYCCWCAQDLAANHFWQSMGFVPIAFRAGSDKKRACGRRGRVHIFWQRRINADDVTTAYWYPCQTSSGAIRADRLVLPIPPGVHWSDPMPVIVPEAPAAISDVEGQRKLPAPRQRKTKVVAPKPALNVITEGGMRFGAAQPALPEAKPENKPRAKKPKARNDPKLVAAARELRDRWLEHANAHPEALVSQGKYDVSRALPPAQPSPATPLLVDAA